jgi:tetratricopeptide (TPR) repeat protein
LPRSRRPRCSELAALLLVALFWLVAGGVAHADDDVVEAYRHAVERGAELFERQDYAGARAAFEGAYEIHAEPTLVFNIASTYRREGNLEEAVAAYRRYLSLSTGDDDARRQLARETIEALVDTLARRAASERAERERQERVERERQERAERERQKRAEREAEARREREERAAAAQTHDGPPPPTPRSLTFEPAPEPSPWRPRMRVASTGLGVVGGLALGYAAVNAMRARDAETTLSETTSWDQREEQLYRDGSAARRRALIAGGIGVGLAGAGAALYLLSREPAGERQLTVSPSLHGDGAGAVVHGSF